MLTDNVDEVINNPEIKVVAHLVGGLEPERTIMLRLLESGKDVVTANKALLAEHGPELFDRARELGRSIAFEASVAGGIPIIANISQCLSANQIESLARHPQRHEQLHPHARCTSEGAPYAEALAEAQRLGYAEADPTMDVDGSDAAQKLAILAHLAFGARVDWKDIPRMGIDTLDVGRRAITPRRWATGSSCWPWPSWTATRWSCTCRRRWCKRGTPLAEVSGPFNAIRVVGDAVGPLFFHGQGAGQMPTASAVVADMIDTAVGRTAITFRTLELWSNRKARVTPRRATPADGPVLPAGRWSKTIRACWRK